MTAADAVLVALGAAVGAPLRYLVGHWLRDRWGAAPTSGTLAVNVAGSLALGLLVGADVQGAWFTLVGMGFCGALTTFSTLALQLWEAWDDGPHRHALADLTLSLALGLGAAALGWWVAIR